LGDKFTLLHRPPTTVPTHILRAPPHPKVPLTTLRAATSYPRFPARSTSRLSTTLSSATLFPVSPAISCPPKKVAPSSTQRPCTLLMPTSTRWFS